MKMYGLKKISENKYQITGKINYFVSRYKSVVVDGETYTKSWRDEINTTIDELFNKNDEYKCTINVDEFKPFGIPKFDVIHLRGISNYKNQSGFCGYGISENSDVNFFTIL
jgi:hypothetical protein